MLPGIKGKYGRGLAPEAAPLALQWEHTRAISHARSLQEEARTKTGAVNKQTDLTPARGARLQGPQQIILHAPGPAH